MKIRGRVVACLRVKSECNHVTIAVPVKIGVVLNSAVYNEISVIRQQLCVFFERGADIV